MRSTYGKSLMLIVGAAVFLGLSAGCTTKAKTTEEKASEASPDITVVEEKARASAERTDVSGQLARVAASESINQLRKADPIDWAAIEKTYTEQLQETVKKRDAEAGITLDSAILQAIAQGKAGKEPKVNGQRVSKNLLRAFYLSIKHEFDEAKETFADKSEEGALHKWDEAEAYFGGLAGSGFFKDHPEVKAEIEEAFAEGREKISADDRLGMILESQVVDKSLIRYFSRSAEKELEEAVEARGSNPGEAAEKLAEGRLFFSVVAEKYKSQSKEIEAQLNNLAAADPAKVSKLLNQGLVSKVISELDETLSTWGTEDAPVKAKEGQVYFRAIKDSFAEKRGEAAAEEMGEKLSSIVEAARSGDKAQTEQAVSEAKKLLAEYQASL